MSDLTPVTCAALDARLAALLADELDPATRQAEITALRAHVETCAHCAGAADLIELADAPGFQRDPIDPSTMPPDGYWESFDERVRTRVAGTPARRGVHPLWAAAAALLLAVPLIAMLLSGRHDVTAPATDPELARLFEQSSTDEIVGAVELVAGLQGPWEAEVAEVEDVEDVEELVDADSSWPFPDTEELDPDVGRKLLDWLRQQEGATG